MRSSSVEYALVGRRWVGDRAAVTECGRTSGVVANFDELRSRLLDEGVLKRYASPWIYGAMYEVAVREKGPPPAERLARVLRFVHSCARYEEVIEPILADAEHEWVDAVLSNDRARARHVRLRCNVQVLQATGMTMGIVRLGAWVLDWLR